MSETLLSGKLLSGTEELKLEFQERKKLLPAEWINIYMDRFCNDIIGKEYNRIKIWLYNCQRTNSAAPNLTILKNIDILINENNWEIGNINTLLQWK